MAFSPYVNMYTVSMSPKRHAQEWHLLMRFWVIQDSRPFLQAYVHPANQSFTSTSLWLSNWSPMIPGGTMSSTTLRAVPKSKFSPISKSLNQSYCYSSPFLKYSARVKFQYGIRVEETIYWCRVTILYPLLDLIDKSGHTFTGNK